MRIFKAHYLKPNTIYQLLGKVDKDIREAFTGGAVDVYRYNNGDNLDVRNAINERGRKDLYYYDVNSLYPFIMSNLTMPSGKPIAFEGNILDIISHIYNIR